MGQIQVSTGFSYVGEKAWGNNAKFAGTGLDFSLRKHINEKLKLGANIGIYDMRVGLTIQTQSDVLPLSYGKIFKRVVPISVLAEYYLWNKKVVKPFVGIETGTYVSQYDAHIVRGYESLVKDTPLKNSINWGFSPSAGVQFQDPTDRLGVYIKMKYSGIAYTESQGGFSSLYSIHAGFTFKFGKKIYWRPPVLSLPKPASYYEKKSDI
jgi:hypothetical protein